MHVSNNPVHLRVLSGWWKSSLGPSAYRFITARSIRLAISSPSSCTCASPLVDRRAMFASDACSVEWHSAQTPCRYARGRRRDVRDALSIVPLVNPPFVNPWFTFCGTTNTSIPIRYTSSDEVKLLGPEALTTAFLRFCRVIDKPPTRAESHQQRPCSVLYPPTEIGVFLYEKPHP